MNSNVTEVAANPTYIHFSSGLSNSTQPGLRPARQGKSLAGLASKKVIDDGRFPISMAGCNERIIHQFCAKKAPVVIGILEVGRDRLRVGKSFGRRGRSVQRGAVELLFQLGVGDRFKPDAKRSSVADRPVSKCTLSWL